MEAIAHSPSFAKKAGVPQSVGKDYAAADKGKTFKRGGDMKGYADGGMPMVNKGGKMVPSFAADGVGKMAKGGEPKKMIGKEVAFMKKKGAPKSMLKHEKAEMKGMKAGGKVRRMAGGGMGMGDPFALSDEDVAKYEKNGAENERRLKDFFGFGKKEVDSTGERPAPKPPESVVSSNNVSSSEGRRTPSGPQRKISSEEIKGPQFTGSLSGGFEDNALAQREPKVGSGASGFNQTPYTDSGFSALNTPSGMKRRKPVTVSETKETKSVTAAPSDSSYDAVEKKRFAKSPSANLAQLRKESEDKIRDSKPGSMTKQMRDAPSISDLYRGQKSMGEEIGDLLKSFRSNIRGGLKTAEEKRKMREEEQHIAKGGKVKAYAQGGFTREADGVAKKGKTQGKVVKMAGGGFVRSADGCAQRGKTRVTQVKMNRGGMC
jgi:hypothetical protein